jgi:ribosomal protein S18 acetylase RimI-like enzyme
LVDFGFYLIDTNVIFKKKIKINDLKDIKNDDLLIRFACIKDKEETTKLSSESFIYSRFHQDEKIPNKIANIIKFRWIENFFNGKRGDDLIIATFDDKVTGFILLIIDKINRNITIDLIAVHKDFRGKNIAKNMIRFLENNFNDYNNIIVGTQIVNIPSINLYESCGFQIDESYYVFHYHHK